MEWNGSLGIFTEIRVCVAIWWRPNLETIMCPYCPSHITKPKVVHLQGEVHELKERLQKQELKLGSCLLRSILLFLLIPLPLLHIVRCMYEIHCYVGYHFGLFKTIWRNFMLSIYFNWVNIDPINILFYTFEIRNYIAR